ncbi:helix-turn-helix domain-containing protein [Rarobacter incanus]|uniref:Excisionase family DNA binding protein n=1 Tax=Rarobacter incanus TaxID=153494 RepID=A0A542SPC6_9MICO|nr:helix-turn-helix domain-containing protein [Rarobacter incanus]TQK76442.1 excisionase family DNA binding protein [Rarobacter incanus]
MTDTIVTTPIQRAAAQAITHAVPVDEPLVVNVRSADSSEEIQLPAFLATLLRNVLEGVASGANIVISTIPEDLTSTVAAKRLGVSRPTLMKLIAQGDIDAFKVGTHTRVKTAEIERYRKQRFERQRSAFEEFRNVDRVLSSGE